jgi:lysophospholipase L1-like esterase
MKITKAFSRALLATATLLAVASSAPSHAAVEQVPVRILTLGDSITHDGAWQNETERLLTSAGVANIIVNVAVSGTRCGYWPERIGALLATHQPDLVVLACGTNDDPAERTSWGESMTAWSTRYVIEAVHAYRPANPARTLPVLVQYSDPLIAPAWLLANEGVTNDTLYVNQMLYASAPQLAGIANLQTIPATADYVSSDGIHPVARGYKAIGRTVYDAARASMGWPVSGESALCGQYGHRAGYPRPTYTPCP